MWGSKRGVVWTVVLTLVALATAAVAGGGGTDALLPALAFCAAVLAAASLYFAPTIVAWRRNAPDPAVVLVVNLFLGLTMIGWVVALALAFRDAR